MPTLNHRLAIQILAINDSVDRWNFELNGANYRYFMAGLIAIFNIVIYLGKLLTISSDIPQLVLFAYNVIIIIILSCLYGFLNINIKEKG